MSTPHPRQRMKPFERWQVIVPVVVAVIAAIGVIAGALINRPSGDSPRPSGSSSATASSARGSALGNACRELVAAAGAEAVGLDQLQDSVILQNGRVAGLKGTYDSRREATKRSVQRVSKAIAAYDAQGGRLPAGSNLEQKVDELEHDAELIGTTELEHLDNWAQDEPSANSARNQLTTYIKNANAVASLPCPE